MINRSALPDTQNPRRANSAGFNPSRKLRQKIAGASLATIALLGGTYAKHVYNGIEADNKQPSCDVTAHNGDSVNKVIDKISKNGDDVRAQNNEVFDGVTGEERTPDNTRKYYIDRGVLPGDIVRVSHVNPDVCVAVGGTPVAANVKVVAQGPST